MQFKQTLVRLFFLLVPFISFSQTTYFPQGAKENILLDRLEIKAKTDSLLNFSKTRPFSRETIVEALDSLVKKNGTSALSAVDRYNLELLLASNREFLPESSRLAFDSMQKFKSKRPFLKHFYKTPYNLYEVNAKDFFLAINPVFQYYVGKENNSNEHIFLNTRGVTMRGRIANKIGFSAYITDNQERDPRYVREWENERMAVPGQGFYKPFKTGGYDYFDARGYVTAGITRYIDLAFGYDKNFIGNGYRSLFLSDFSNSALFLKLNTRIWKFNYQNLFMELQAAKRTGADILIPKKYAAIHHLDINITKWLNVGLFEGVIFGRADHFDFSYLNPVIFYRSVEQQNGSFDNAVAGFDAKANVAKKFQFYTQFLLDEFNLTELRKGSGWWGNKFGLQLGAKYIDAFNIKNLDLQVETNRVRPFTYSHRDSVANYTHYNQPLAHPLGANFQEWIGILRYQPAPKWYLEAKAFYFVQGKDTANMSFGSNIFFPNIPPYRTQEFGYDIGSGLKTKHALASFLLSYEWKPNFFIEINPVIRKEAATAVSAARNTFVIYGGVRWNMHRRAFEF
jgi:hypothetical protein